MGHASFHPYTGKPPADWSGLRKAWEEGDTKIAQLERELTAAKEENARLAKSLETSRAYCSKLDGILEEVGDVTVSCINPYEDIKRALAAQKAELALLRTESQEQARLLGMSGEREADLRGEIERLRRRVEAADEVMELAVKCASNERWNIMNTGLPLDWYGAYLNYYGAYRATEGKKP